MKFLFLVVVAVIFINLEASGQKGKPLQTKVKPVPSIVRTAFKQKFPTIKRAIWDNESKKSWEAEFRMNGSEYSVFFDINGTWLKTEHEIKSNEIPHPVKSKLNSKFSDCKVLETVIVETQKRTMYVVELKKDKEKIKVAFDPDGTILKQEKGKLSEEDFDDKLDEVSEDED